MASNFQLIEFQVELLSMLIVFIIRLRAESFVPYFSYSLFYLGHSLSENQSKLQQVNFNSQMSTKSPLRSVSSLPMRPPAFDPSVYVTKNLPLDDVMKLKQCFDIFDYDKSGNVSSQQLLTAIKALGLQKQAGKVLQILNFQNSQVEMDFESFLKIFGFNGENQTHSNLKQLFEIFDKNGVGSFGVEEFTQLCQSVGQRFSQAEIQQMIEYADKDKDGRINFDEFVQVVTKQYPTV